MKRPSQPILIDNLLLDQTSEAALASPRRRKNHNFHTSEAEGANRLLNAVEPGSYIQPHRHLDSTKDETFVVVRGRFGLVLFDEAGDVRQTAILAGGTDSVGANIQHGTYHTLVSLRTRFGILRGEGGSLRADQRCRAGAVGAPRGRAAGDRLPSQARATVSLRAALARPQRLTRSATARKRSNVARGFVHLQ